ncbi:MAG TPA: EamA family transporter [Burkholderiales bacterium]|nr:EamA family transporter [Burkholderiales bacterium]
MTVVLLAALMHAAWNVIVKSGADKLLDITKVTTGAALVGAAVLLGLPAPSAASWPYLAASATVHCAYFWLVAAAYRSGDLSLAYPVMRGTAPLLTALLSYAIFPDSYSAYGWAGIAALSAGIWLLASEARRHLAHQGRSMLFGLGNALVIVAYTLVDGAGVRLSHAPWSYVAWLFVLNALPLLVLLRVTRGSRFLAGAASTWLQPLLGGALTFGSYGLALWAMTQAPVALVAALRESSVVFGVVLAALLLKEKFGATRWSAALLVACGAAALKLA